MSDNAVPSHEYTIVTLEVFKETGDANLQHPQLAPLYGSGVTFLVKEEVTIGYRTHCTGLSLYDFPREGGGNIVE